MAGFQHACAKIGKNRSATLPRLISMQLGMVATRRSVCIDCEATVLAASRSMRENSVSELVVTERQGDDSLPIGILSAREIVTRVLALELDASVLKVGDVLWAPAFVMRVTDSVTETLARLCETGGEALPVIHGDGRLAGVVCLDDLLEALASSESATANRFRGR
jgi:CBS domain-containing protein